MNRKLSKMLVGLARKRCLIIDYIYCGELLNDEPVDPNFPEAYATRHSDYLILDRVFKKIKIQESDVLVDVGCGKGRVILWWLKQGLKNQIFGVEIKDDIADETKKRFSKFPNVTVVKGSVIDYFPMGTIYFLCNPFEKPVMEKFKNLFLACDNAVLIYYVPDHIDVFRNDPRFEVEDFSIKYPLINEAQIVFIRKRAESSLTLREAVANRS